MGHASAGCSFVEIAGGKLAGTERLQLCYSPALYFITCECWISYSVVDLESVFLNILHDFVHRLGLGYYHFVRNILKNY